MPQILEREITLWLEKSLFSSLLWQINWSDTREKKSSRWAIGRLQLCSWQKALLFYLKTDKLWKYSLSKETKRPLCDARKITRVKSRFLRCNIRLGKTLSWTHEKVFQIPGHSSVVFTELGDEQQPYYL